MSFDIHSLYSQIFKIWRKKRFQQFLDIIKPQPDEVLLDVGGTPYFWLSFAQPVKRIDALNVTDSPWDRDGHPRHNIHTSVGDGCALGMPDKSYEIGFSNSVIEHVGSWDNQKRFASEIRRVAQRLWVQTPAYECPIEPHYIAPFVHYLPHSVQRHMIRWGTLRGWLSRPSKAWINEMIETTRLLKKSEMKELFPDCEILTERFLWIFPKSYIAIRK